MNPPPVDQTGTRRPTGITNGGIADLQIILEIGDKITGGEFEAKTADKPGGRNRFPSVVVKSELSGQSVEIQVVGGPAEKTIQVLTAPDGGIIIIDEQALQRRTGGQIEDSAATQLGVDALDADAQPKMVGFPVGSGDRERPH